LFCPSVEDFVKNCLIADIVLSSTPLTPLMSVAIGSLRHDDSPLEGTTAKQVVVTPR
jgi:hypothetical protein